MAYFSPHDKKTVQKNRVFSAVLVLCVYGLLTLLASCAPHNTEKRLESLEQSAIDQQVIDARLVKVEEHLHQTDARFVAGRAMMPEEGPNSQAMAQGGTYPLSGTPIDSGPSLSPVGGMASSVPRRVRPQVVEQEPTRPVATQSALVQPPVTEPTSARSRSLPAEYRSGNAAYDAALTRYFQNDFTGAAQEFSAFANNNPGHKLVPNALYWLGECHYSKRDFPSAILAFKNVTAQFPKHPKSAAALLKLGMSYSRIGDKDNARFYWQILLEDFPRSAPAGLARSQMR